MPGGNPQKKEEKQGAGVSAAPSDDGSDDEPEVAKEKDPKQQGQNVFLPLARPVDLDRVYNLVLRSDEFFNVSMIGN